MSELYQIQRTNIVKSNIQVCFYYYSSYHFCYYRSPPAHVIILKRWFGVVGISDNRKAFTFSLKTRTYSHLLQPLFKGQQHVFFFFIDKLKMVSILHNVY